MASPYSTGGGGTHFESRVVAYYLAAILSESPARGVLGRYAVQALTQRAAFDEPLDDIIVKGLLDDGRQSKLHLQIKSDLAFTDKDDEWVSVLQQSWDTFQGVFDNDIDRLGIAISTYSARADRHYQSVLKWATYSVSGKYFIDRIRKEDYSHKIKSEFVETVRTVLESYSSQPVDDELIWRFLRSFVILHFDFALEKSSRDTEGVQDRLRALLPSDQRQQAGVLWDHLVAKAGELIPVGGGATRATLVQQLKTAGQPTGTASAFWNDLKAINEASKQGLGDIKSDIHGLYLHRRQAYEEVKQALAEGRFVQINGEPGTGKSALLKDIAEECNRLGPIFFLKDSRIHPHGWSAHAHVLSVSADAAALLREFGSAGEPILFIDGIDRISDPAVQLTVNDLVRIIAYDEGLSGWRILATVREQNLEHIATWLDPDALKKLPMRNVSVLPLEGLELVVIAERFPQLRPLLLESGSADVILRRPFFLEAVLTLSGNEGSEPLPTSEVELLSLWWKFGGAEIDSSLRAQRRRTVLLELAERYARASKIAIPIRGLEPEPLEELKSAGVLRDKELGHSVIYSHDIYEEWSLSELLIRKQLDIAEFLRRVGEPQALVRPMQVLGAYLLETNATELEWKTLYERVSDVLLRPVWQRAILTSCIRSTRTQQLLNKLAGYLSENENSHLKRLLVALRTIEVVPNPSFLDEKLFPDLEPDERVKYANLMAVPKLLPWNRFLDWFMHQPGLPWPTLIPDLLPVFETWQNTCAGQKIRHCRNIGEVAHHWLLEFEMARHPDRWQDRRNPFGIEIEHDDMAELEESIRSLFLSSVGDVPELVSEYLRDHSSGERKHIFRDNILSKSVPLARHVPETLVDYILKASLESPSDNEDKWRSYPDHIEHDLGVADHFSFYPASPAQPPFLVLLREYEPEGLRLVRALCNHSITVWKWTKQRTDWRHEALTPVPLDIVFPWGSETFWGNGQVYLWFRGVWGNHAVCSALMALEQWAFEQIEQGRSFDDVFRTVIEGNGSVTALGLGASLCIAYPDKSISCALPLVTCPYVWKWDIARLVQDTGGMQSNEMADWHRYKHLLTAVRALNVKPHRRRDIRTLLPYFVFHPDPEVKNQYAIGVRQFTENLPFEFAEERGIAELVAELQDQMQLFYDQAAPEYWKSEPTEDGKAIKLWNDPPSLRKPKYLQQSEQHNLLSDYLALSLWAEKSLTDKSLDSRFTVTEGIARARALDAPDLFIQLSSVQEILLHHRQAAVAGAAFVAARFHSADTWETGIGSWCFDVLRRAATAPEAADALSIRSLVLSIHPVVFAANGFSALLRRGFSVRHCQLSLLSLAVDAAEGVVAAVASSAEQYAADYPKFYWVLFDLLIRQCIVKVGAMSDYHSMVWNKQEAKHKLGLLNAAEKFLDSGLDPSLPNIPLPWIKQRKADLSSPSETGGFRRNRTAFLWNLAQKAVLDVQLEPILPDVERRRQFVRLIGQLVTHTIQEIVPPFANSRRDNRGNTPFEWVFAVFNWLGRLATQLTAKEVKSEVLSRLFVVDNDTALLAMQSLVPAYMIKAFLPPAEIDEEHLSLWEEITAWIFDNIEANRATDRHISREYSTCALATLFCVHGDFGPLFCGVEQGWPHLHRFASIVARAVRQFGMNRTLFMAVALFFKKGGFDLLPDPGLGWLLEIAVSKKHDQEFWRPNGEETVEILKTIHEKKAFLLNAEHQKTISLISDILVDNGVRGAGFLQQELLRGE